MKFTRTTMSSSLQTVEQELGVSHVIVDGPQGFANSVPQVWEVTNPKLAIFRLHGRNTMTWNVLGQTAASDRFNYDYPEADLTGFVAPTTAFMSSNAPGA